MDYGPSLDGGDYNSAPIAGNIGETLSTTPVVEYKTLDVTPSVLNDITNARTRSQYRIRFSIQDFDSDFSDDLAAFTDSEDACLGAKQPPQLVIALAP